VKIKPEVYSYKPGKYRLMRCSSYFIAKERKSASSHTNRFKPITPMSVYKDAIF